MKERSFCMVFFRFSHEYPSSSELSSAVGKNKFLFFSFLFPYFSFSFLSAILFFSFLTGFLLCSFGDCCRASFYRPGWPGTHID